MNNKPGSVYCRHLSETAVSGRFLQSTCA